MIKKSLLNFFFLLGFLVFLESFANAQTGTITGKVTDEASNPLSGVTVKLVGTTYAIATDAGGNYKLEIPSGNYTIEFSYLGYVSTKRKINLEAGKTLNINSSLKEDSKTLDEVVAVGYGTKSKREVTGSQISLKGKELTDMPSQSFENGIQGKAAGVQAITGSGMAGSAALIRIRGVASLSAGGDPLYVVDGIPITQDYFMNGNSGGFNNNPLATINPNDIEDIQILKDAAATSIYGSRGANGVILITTKRAKKNGLSFDFTARTGIALPTVKPQMLNNKEWLQLYQEAWENDGNVGKAKLPNNISWEDAEKTNTDWIDETMGLGFKQMYSLGTSYRRKKFAVYGTLSWDDNGSYVKGNKYSRTSGRLNFDINPIKNLNIAISTSLSRGTNTRVDAAWSGGFGAAMSTALPIFSIYDTAGEYLNLGPNPVRVRNLKDWKTIENRSINNITANYVVNSKLTFTAVGSVDFMNFKEDRFEAGKLINKTTPGQTNLYMKTVLNSNYNVIANYTILKNVLHDFKAMLGTEYQRFENNSENFFASNVTGPGNEIGFQQIMDSSKSTTGKYEVGETIIDAFNSYFGRLDYSYKKKYYAQFTFRSDGSSRFGPKRRFGYFPAVSVGWIVSDEEFMKKYKFASFLKLRSGIGYTGNANFASNKWYQAWTPISTGTLYNGAPISSTSYHKNPNLQWENSRVFDISLEYGLFKNRISGEISFYNKKTSDVLTELAVPRTTGFGTYYGNAGAILNQGFEFSIKSTNYRKGLFSWTTDFNIARNYNKVLNLGIYSQEAISGGTNDTRVVVGAPVGTNFLVRYSHIDKQTGKPVYLDINGNETFLWNTDNRVNVGSVLPKAVGGITNDFRYGSWNLNFLLVYKIGGNIYNSSQKRQDGVMNDIGGGYWNRTTESFDRWQKPGDDASLPRMSLVPETYGLSDAWNNNSTRWLYDGSYLRLRNVTIGYNLPKKWFKDKISNFRVTANGTNLLTFSKVKNIDPEIARDFENASDRNMSSNIVWLTAPQEKTYNLTINITF